MIKKTTHLGWLDAIRGSAALYVVCHHAVMQVVVIGDHANDPFYRLLQLLTSYGHYAVDVFIVLSGYSLMLPIIAKQQFGDIWIFYLRRTLRIVLPYFSALIFTLIIIYFWLGVNDASHWAEVSLPLTKDSIFKHILLIHQWFPDAANKINPAFWSVGVEYQIYFLFPIFYLLARAIGFVKAFVVITVTSYVLWAICYYFDILNPGPNGASLYYCSLFFMGMLAAQFTSQTQKTTNFVWHKAVDTHALKIAVLACVGILIIAVLSFVVSRSDYSFYFPLQVQSFFVGLLFAILLYLKGSNKIFKQSALLPPIFLHSLKWTGTIGFSIYLIHDPIIALVWKYVVIPLSLPFYWLQALTELVLGVIATVFVAVLFYKLIELPCHRLSKSIVKK